MDIIKTGTLILVSLLTSLSLAKTWAAPAMTWSQYDAPNANVYYSSDGANPTQITSSGVNVLPNLFHSDHSTWVTWVNKTRAAANQLMYARLSKTGQILETGTLPTEHGRLYAPAIALDSSEQRVWLVWVESEGRVDKLFASYRNIGNKNDTEGWQTPLQITPDDLYSADMPVIDSAYYDRVQVSWLRSSINSFESASAEIPASEWSQATQAAKVEKKAVGAAGKGHGKHYRALKLSNMKNTDRLMKRLYRGRSRSPDEQAWEDAIHGKNVLTGAIHSPGKLYSNRLAQDNAK